MKTRIFFLLLPFLLSFFMIHFASTVHAADGDFVWAKAMGGSLDDYGESIVVDSAGNVYTTGYFRGTVDFDPGPGVENLTSVNSSRDIFISKLNSSGNLVWARSMGNFADDIGFGIFVDSSGNVYTTGGFSGTVDFDPGPDPSQAFELTTSIGITDIFVSKLDSSGNFAGAWAMGGNSDDFGNGIFVDASGNIYTTGYFKNTADFDPGAGTVNLVSDGVEDIFISKLDSNGNYSWAIRIGGASADVGLGLSLYSSGHVYITGWFRDTVLFGTGPGSSSLISNGLEDIFISKLDSTNGDVVWARSIGGISIDAGEAVSVDSSGNVYTTGLFIGTVDFNPAPGTEPSTVFELTSSSPNASDIFVSKLDSGGNFVWARHMGGTVSDVGYGISVDSSGNVYTTGFFGDTADFDPGPGTASKTSNGSEDIFISKLDSGGNFVWAKAMGGTSVDYGYDISVDSLGNVFTTGFFQDLDVDFDPGDGTFNLSSKGFQDIFISKLAGGDAFPWKMFLPAIINNDLP